MRDGASLAPYSLEELTVSINDANPALTGDEQHLALAMYELLARGEPVGIDELAKRNATDDDWVTDRIGRWSGVFRDEEGRVIGF